MLGMGRGKIKRRLKSHEKARIKSPFRGKVFDLDFFCQLLDLTGTGKNRG